MMWSGSPEEFRFRVLIRRKRMERPVADVGERALLRRRRLPPIGARGLECEGLGFRVSTRFIRLGS